MNGFVVLDKVGGITSRDAIDRLRLILPRGSKFGHTGTLDPLATGVLVVAIGQATRLADRVQAMGKSYSTTLRLGAATDSNDADGRVSETPNATDPGIERIAAYLAGMVGTIDQVPPQTSSVKVDGQRSYALARKGRVADLAARPVRIDAIRIAAYDWPHLDLEIDCGKGTYIRAIARDLGEALGCGGYVLKLRRDRVGGFVSSMAIPAAITRDELERALVPMLVAVSGVPRVDIVPEAAEFLCMGRSLPDDARLGGEVAIVLHGELFALCESIEGRLQPHTVLKRREES